MLPHKATREPATVAPLLGWESIGATLLEPFDEGLCLLSLDGRILCFSRAAARILGAVDRDWTGTSLTALLPENERSRLKDHLLQTAQQGSARLKTQLNRPSGASAHVDIYLVPADMPETTPTIACRIVDTTHQKAIEARLLQERNLTSSILDTVGALVVVLDAKGQIVRLNRACEDLTGYSFAEVYGRPFWEFLIPPDQVEAVRDVFSRLAAGSFPNQYENDWIHRNGTRRWIAWSNTCILDDAGAVQYVIGTGIDTTGRRMVEQALAAEKERLSVTLHSIGEGVITTDEQGRVALLNSVAERLTGWSSQEALGLPAEQVFRVIDENSRESLISPVRKVLASGETQLLQNHTILISRTGQEYIIHDCAAPIRDSAGATCGAVLVFRDTTYRTQLEAEYIRSQKLESLGLLSKRIAHDFNNLLTIISGNLELAHLELPAESPVADRLVDAEAAVQRAHNLAVQLSTLAQGGTPVRKPIGLQPVIEQAARLALTGSAALCEFYFPEDLWIVDADEGQISQVVSNLVLNAEQSMGGRGTITITARNCPPGTPEGTPLPPGRYVEVAVKDNGPGIPANILPKIFEPFFSTKRPGRGLGLTSCDLIVRKHDGYLRVESTVGQGATFWFYLSASSRKSADPPAPKPEVRRGTGRILLLDDDSAVREVSADILRFLGYQVDCCENGDDTIRKYSEALLSGKPYRAVILDLTIPGGMGGLETLQILRSVDPDVRALVTSGYTNDPILVDFRKYGFSGAVVKPFEVGDLAEAIARSFENVNSA
ncbi:MAG: PAS domain S-box protein [Myxococcales bacterium]|nr:PAS domain S-box protein [Myxococcales bacterium]